MAFTNRAELRTAVKAWLALSGGEVADSVINDWIRLCEADLNRRLRVIDRQETATLTVSSAVVAAPTGFRRAHDLYLTTDPVSRVLLRSAEQVRAMQANVASGKPIFYAVKGDTTNNIGLIFAPAPDTTYTGAMTYWREFQFSSDSDTSAIMNNWPDVYLYGTLLHAEGYLGNDPRMQVWEDQYLEGVAGIIAEDAENQKAQS